ncbi:MAG: DNA-protecting protein DprA [Planctomycetota bacterium]|nr:MAG: DNA-protecting protein DprA [Planctomycetota bacterium]
MHCWRKARCRSTSWNDGWRRGSNGKRRRARKRCTRPEGGMGNRGKGAVSQVWNSQSGGEGKETLSEAGRWYLRLHLATHVGPVRARRLIDHFGSAEGACRASVARLERVEGVGPAVARSLAAMTDEAVEREAERAARHGLRILCPEDAEYPLALRRIPDPPLCLYVRGHLRETDAVAVAVVGTRRCSYYGREQAKRFGEMLAGAGFTLVSGLARGIDAHAHIGALRAGGRTLAVLGNGLPDVYPPEHQRLADEVAESGSLLSELPVGTGPTADNFPRRNRIIAGLSLGVVVIEAGKQSGALITARLANEYNREVFAVPGRVDHPETSAGVNTLIRDGSAKLVTSLEDILDELGEVGEVMGRAEPASDGGAPSGLNPQQQASASPPNGPCSEEQRVVFEAVRAECDTPDRIMETTGLSMGRVMASLTALQLKGLVRQEAGPRFYARGRN